MFVTLRKDAHTGATTPLYYSVGLFSAKQDLKRYCTKEFGTILSYKYSLDEFNNVDVNIARFADECQKSVELIRVTKEIIPATWFYDEVIKRNISSESMIYLCEVEKYGDCGNVSTSIPIPIESKGRGNSNIDIITGSPYDSVLRELNERFNSMNDV